MRHPRSAAGLLLVALSLVTVRPALARSADERESTFWKIGVVDFTGRTPQVTGQAAAQRFASGLKRSRRFHVVDRRSVRAAVRLMEVVFEDGRITDADARRLCKELELDGLFAGRLERRSGGAGLSLSLHSASGRLFSRYRFAVSPAFTQREADDLARASIARLPYDGLVVSVRGDLALVNLGLAQGVTGGAKLYAFELDSMHRDEAGAKVGPRSALAELEVVRAERHGAWVRPRKGEMPELFTKISRKPVSGLDRLKVIERVADEPSAVPVVGFEIDGDTALLFKRYRLEGTGQRYSSKTTLFPAPGLRATWYPTRRFGVGASYRRGFIPFRRPVGDPPDETVESFDGTVDLLVVEGKVRHLVGGSGLLSGSSVAGSIGWYDSRFAIEDQDPRVLTSDRYAGLLVAVETRVPIYYDIGVGARLGVVPRASVTERPVHNGSAQALGLTGTVGLDYHADEHLFVRLEYGFESMRTRFPSAGGSRGVLSPESSDVYHGATLTIGWRGYR